ncbi:hypothetical protein GF337_16495, partial [candidate division KSB1 bacterium]|nr:hypothetical protein [candidate division KSB1 bacterium]
ELYKPDGIPVTFDLQIEAEALGCELQWAKENPPAVITHVLDDKSLSDLTIPDENSGRFPEVFKAVRSLNQKAGDVAIYGLVTGPFTLALHLKGTNIFMDMFDDPDAVHELMKFCTKVASKVSGMYLDAGCDIIALVDPMTSQISPDAFRTFVTPYATEVFNGVRERGALSSFFVCGHAQKNIEAMCETKPDNVSVDENIPLDYVKEICRKHRISFGGNLQLTVVLLMGTQDDCRRDAMECINIGGDAGFILAPGCDLPYSVPPKNLQVVTDLVYDPYQRQVAQELLHKKKEVKTDIDLSEYGQSDKVVVDVITLDSEACAPCQYMVEAVKKVAPYFNDLVIWREHKIKEKESVEFMMGLMVKNIPTICIDGKIKFVSNIPSRDELVAAIQERINEKFGMKLRRQHSRLLVLGAGCEKCAQTLQNVQQAAKELGSTVEIVHVTDENQFHQYGVAATPAVIAVEERVKISGRVPSVEVVKEWLKEL